MAIASSLPPGIQTAAEVIMMERRKLEGSHPKFTLKLHGTQMEPKLALMLVPITTAARVTRM